MIIITGRPHPKKNNKRIFHRYGKTVVLPSKAYSNWHETALKEIMAQRPAKHLGAVFVDCTFYIKGKYHVDIDNLVNSILDLLVESKVIEDDDMVVDLHARKFVGCADWSSKIVIYDSES